MQQYPGQQFTGLLGVLTILALGVLLSTNRRAINRRTIVVYSINDVERPNATCTRQILHAYGYLG